MLNRITRRAASIVRQFSQYKLWQVGTATIVLPMALVALTAHSASLERVKKNFPTAKPSGFEFFPQLLAQRERRTALVIGNGNYGAEGKLNNPPNDAADVAKALRELGFEVTLLQDQDKRQIEEAISQFNRQLRQGEVGVFYYAGHGVQVDGENYLIPIGARIEREQDVPYEAIPLGKILGAMEDAQNSVNIVLIDACRNNPYSRGWRSSSRGLAFVQSAQGTFISFATAPGKVAADGGGRNSPYTAGLLKHIRDPGIPVPLLFQRVRKEVRDQTNGKQTPWEASSLIGDFAFNSPESVASPSSSQIAPSTQPSKPATPTPSTSRPNPTVSVSAPSLRPPAPSAVPSLPKEPILISKTTGINYARLRDLLAAGKWKEADVETERTMFKAVGREKERWLTDGDIEKFPCEDLSMIDRLWSNASDGKFGLSAQSEIYRGLGGVLEKFFEQVGWSRKGRWVGSDGLTYSMSGSPRGHLPTMGRAEASNEDILLYPYNAFSFLTKCKLYLSVEPSQIPAKPNFTNNTL